MSLTVRFMHCPNLHKIGHAGQMYPEVWVDTVCSWKACCYNIRQIWVHLLAPPFIS